ncbi:MAG: cytochrome c oxidase subunit II [Proteobacteria bacterium]|nr:cytochrome c oxidase subunit II [Pseudomonadota bacterium]
MFVVYMLILVAAGTIAFHLFSPWWSTEIASNWGYIDMTIDITFWVTGVVFIFVMLFMAYCVWRYRYKAGKRAAYEPENTKMELWLTGLTTVGVVVMLTPGLFVWNDFVTVPEGAAEFEVVGQQWQWSYRFPGKDGVLGTSDVRKISDENPFGLNPDDPNGQDDVLVEDDELHLPLDQPVKVLLRSIDVLHDFYVPQFRAKMDLVPGQVTYFWFTPTRTGTFDILCFELCGVGHHTMRGKVVVEEESAFKAWLQTQPTFAQSMAKAATGTGDGVKLVSSEAVSAERASTMGPKPLEPDESKAKRVF